MPISNFRRGVADVSRRGSELPHVSQLRKKACGSNGTGISGVGAAKQKIAIKKFQKICAGTTCGRLRRTLWSWRINLRDTCKEMMRRIRQGLLTLRPVWKEWRVQTMLHMVTSWRYSTAVAQLKRRQQLTRDGAEQEFQSLLATTGSSLRRYKKEICSALRASACYLMHSIMVSNVRQLRICVIQWARRASTQMLRIRLLIHLLIWQRSQSTKRFWLVQWKMTWWTERLMAESVAARTQQHSLSQSLISLTLQLQQSNHHLHRGLLMKQDCHERLAEYVKETIEPHTAIADMTLLASVQSKDQNAGNLSNADMHATVTELTAEIISQKEILTRELRQMQLERSKEMLRMKDQHADVVLQLKADMGALQNKLEQQRLLYEVQLLEERKAAQGTITLDHQKQQTDVMTLSLEHSAELIEMKKAHAEEILNLKGTIFEMKHRAEEQQLTQRSEMEQQHQDHHAQMQEATQAHHNQLGQVQAAHNETMTKQIGALEQKLFDANRDSVIQSDDKSSLQKRLDTATARIHHLESQMDEQKEEYEGEVEVLLLQKEEDFKSIRQNHAEKIVQLKDTFACGVEKSDTDSQKKLDKMQSEHHAELSRMSVSHQQAISQAEQKVEEVIEACKQSESGQMQQITALKANHDDEIQVLKSSHDDEIQVLKTSHENEIQAVHDDYEDKMKAVELSCHEQVQAIQAKLDMCKERMREVEARKVSIEREFSRFLDDFDQT